MSPERSDLPLDATLEGVEPQALWAIFDRLRRIPRESGNETAAMNYLRGLADELCLEHATDAAGNVCIKVPGTAGYEDAPAVCLQNHVDMVCAANDEAAYDPAKDGVQLQRDGDVLSAQNTTLGADNGVGLAAALSLAIDPEATHPPLEILITVGEESGLDGARALDPVALGMSSTSVLNMDSEEEGIIYTGSAGFQMLKAKKQVTLEELDTMDGEFFEVAVSGFLGGHSGAEVHKLRGNALLTLAELLNELDEDVRLVSIGGGTGMTQIPREAKAVIFVPSSVELSSVMSAVESTGDAFEASWGEGAEVALTSFDEYAGRRTVISRDVHNQVLNALVSVPDGVNSMSPNVPDLVQTSSNFGVLNMDSDTGGMEASITTRGSDTGKMRELGVAITEVLQQSGFEVANLLEFGGWEEDPDSPLVQTVLGAYEATSGKKGEAKSIHAGLEAGAIADKLKEALSMPVSAVSFGPDIQGVHTSAEHVSLSSVARFYDHLRATLRAMAHQAGDDMVMEAVEVQS